MAGIQTRISDGRGGFRELTHNDPEYWEGPYDLNDRKNHYPKALYRQTQPGQKPECREVKDPDAHEKLGSDWKESPHDAKVAFDRLEADIAKAAAERAASDRRLSVKAQDEALARDRSTDEMRPDLGEAPKKRAYKKKQKPDVPTV